jgi:hypothetical protein
MTTKKETEEKIFKILLEDKEGMVFDEDELQGLIAHAISLTWEECSKQKNEEVLKLIDELKKIYCRCNKTQLPLCNFCHNLDKLTGEGEWK